MAPPGWEVDCDELARAIEAASEQGVHGHDLERAKKILQTATVSTEALTELRSAMEPALCELNIFALQSVIASARTRYLPEEMLDAAQARLELACTAQEAMAALDAQTVENGHLEHFYMDHEMLASLLEAARAAGVPNEKLRVGELQLSRSHQAKASAEALSSAMRCELWSPFESESQRRRADLEAAAAEARVAGVPEEMVEKAERQLSLYAKVGPALSTLHSVTSVAFKRDVDVPLLRATIEECLSEGLRIGELQLLRKAAKMLEACEAERRAVEVMERRKRHESAQRLSAKGDGTDEYYQIGLRRRGRPSHALFGHCRWIKRSFGIQTQTSRSIPRWV